MTLPNPFITLPYDEGTVTIRLDHIDMMMIKPTKYHGDDCGLQIFVGTSWPTINYPSRERAEEVMRCIIDEIDDIANEGGPAE
jgi:hypothetical protein